MLEDNMAAPTLFKPYLSLLKRIDAGEMLRWHLDVSLAISRLPLAYDDYFANRWVNNCCGKDEVPQRKSPLLVRLLAAAEHGAALLAEGAAIDNQ